MTCSHLSELERALLDAGVPETSRGQAWSENCREWVYFDCILDLIRLRARFGLPDVVRDHDHVGTHDGCERGFDCTECRDGIMGRHPIHGPSTLFR